MSRCLSLLLLWIVCISLPTNGLKILGVFPMSAPSHYILGSALMLGLAEKGHDVTIIAPFVEKNPPKNYREILLTGFAGESEKMRSTMNFFDRESSSPVISFAFITSMMLSISEKTIAHENFQKLLHSNEHFDVVIVEQFINDAQKALSTHFNAPLITFSTLGTNPIWLDSLVGNPSPPSYIPILMLDYPTHMNFWQRLYNSLILLYSHALHHLYLYPSHNRAIKKYFPNGPELNDVLYNSSLVLLNSHTSINQPVPLVPSMVEIGGFHVKPPKKLPEDLQKFLDEAKDGVIYFSMGSNLQSSQFPAEKRDAFLNAFSKLKQKVLWKWEEDVLPGQPSNVKLGKWLPQQDILAHPNVKLFITHGGLLSTTETIYNGVPVLAIPIFGDQKQNAARAVHGGYGLMLPYREITEENLSSKLDALLNNPKYSENAKRRSALFHDRLVNPMDTAVYWVEYVARHRGASHLRVAALDLPWYKYHLLDVIAFLVLLSGLSTVITCLVVRRLYRRIFKKNVKVKQN